jgi:hypothetical protein
VSTAKGAPLNPLRTNLATRAQEMQVLVREIAKLHPMTTQSVTIGGTVHAGDLITLNVTPSGGSLQAIAYTVVSGDTSQSIAFNLANKVISNSALQFGTVSATPPSAGAFNLSFRLTPTANNLQQSWRFDWEPPSGFRGACKEVQDKVLFGEGRAAHVQEGSRRDFQAAQGSHRLMMKSGSARLGPPPIQPAAAVLP